MARCETVTYRGRKVCKHSVYKYDAVAQQSGRSFLLTLIQGVLSTLVGASKGTHAGGGVVDYELDGYSWTQAWTVHKLFRKNMLLDWIRWWSGNHHGHVLDPDCPNMSPEAVAQFIEFGNGGDGLVGDSKDPGDRTYASQIMARFKARRGYKNRVMLIQRGMGLYVDGVWGPQTDAAVAKVRASKTGFVKAVQTGLLVDADGVWGSVTDEAYKKLRAAVYKPTTVAPAPIDKTLPYGTFPAPNGSGSLYGPSTAGKNWWSGKVASKTMERWLIRHHIKQIQKAAGTTQDGIYGTATFNAVKAFQKRKRLTVDGLVGPKTWNAM